MTEKSEVRSPQPEHRPTTARFIAFFALAAVKAAFQESVLGFRISGMLLAASLLAGCAVGPDYKRPAVNAPAVFRGEETATSRAVAELTWWRVYEDATLQALIREALTNNYDLRIAVARVEEARAVAMQARSRFVPSVDYNGTVSRGRNDFLGSPFPQGGATASSASATLNAFWELDLWGRIRRLNESARAQFLASEEARRGVRLSLLSDVATAYFQLLELDQELEIASRTTNSFAESLRIFNQRVEGGDGIGLAILARRSCPGGRCGSSSGHPRANFCHRESIVHLAGPQPWADRAPHFAAYATNARRSSRIAILVVGTAARPAAVGAAFALGQRPSGRVRRRVLPQDRADGLPGKGQPGTVSLYAWDRECVGHGRRRGRPVVRGGKASGTIPAVQGGTGGSHLAIRTDDPQRFQGGIRRPGVATATC